MEKKKLKDYPLLSENPIFIEKKKKVESYMDNNSKPLFIAMLIIIAISIIISVISTITRKEKTFVIPSPKETIIDNTTNDFEKMGSLWKEYKSLKEEEKKIDEVLNKLEEHYED